jgi:hypothetical protein
MTLVWIVVAIASVLALAAFITARGAMRRLKQLTEMYWELKYDHGELKAQVKGFTAPEQRVDASSAPVQAFVPLGDLKKK